MKRACLILALPLLIGAPMSADSARGSPADTAGRGPIVSVLAGTLLEGGMEQGFKRGSDLGFSIGYRFNPRSSLALRVSRQRGEPFPDVVERAILSRAALTRSGVQPYLEVGLARYSYKAPTSPGLQGPTNPLHKYGFTLGAGADAPVAPRLSVGAGVSYHFGIEVLSFYPWSDNVDFDYFNLGIALTFAPGGTGWR